VSSRLVNLRRTDCNPSWRPDKAQDWSDGHAGVALDHSSDEHPERVVQDASMNEHCGSSSEPHDPLR
jgi:hypothetical protein